MSGKEINLRKNASIQYFAAMENSDDPNAILINLSSGNAFIKKGVERHKITQAYIVFVRDDITYIYSYEAGNFKHKLISGIRFKDDMEFNNRLIFHTEEVVDSNSKMITPTLNMRFDHNSFNIISPDIITDSNDIFCHVFVRTKSFSFISSYKKNAHSNPRIFYKLSEDKYETYMYIDLLTSMIGITEKHFTEITKTVNNISSSSHLNELE